MSQLHIVTSGGEDHHSELRAEVMANGFAGKGSAWFHHQQILDFATALEVYPLPTGAPPTIAGGYLSEDENGETQVEQEHLYLSIYPLGSLGELGVRVRLATSLQESQRPERSHAVEVEFRTTYQALSDFVKDLRHIAAGEAWSADL